MKENLRLFSIKVWKEGRAIDLWSINHILAGGLLGATVFFHNINLYLGFAISFLIFLAWEIIEIWQNLYEEKWGKVMDVLTSVVSFFIIYFLFTKINLAGALLVFWFLFIAWALLEIWGFVTLRIKQ